MDISSAFTNQLVPAQSFFARMLGRPHVEGFVAELSNILSQCNDVRNVSPDVINKLTRQYKIKKIHHIRNSSLKVIEKICFALTIDNFVEDPVNEINHLARLLGLNEQDVKERVTASAKLILQKEVEVAVKDYEVTDSESEHLDEITKKLGLTREDFYEVLAIVISPIFRKKFNDVLEDGRLSPEEEYEISNLQKKLKIDLQLDEKMRKALDDAKYLWQITEGHIPLQSSPLMLQNDEKCYRAHNAKAVENRMRTRRSSGEKEEYSYLIGSGDLVLTNKRLLFCSRDKSFNIRLNKIVSYEPFIDGVRIFKDSGKPVIFVFDKEDKFFGPLLERAMSEL